MDPDPIRIYGDPVLRKPAPAVDPVSPEVAALIPRMFAAMREADGLGLAAPQIGVDMRVAVIDKRGTENGDQDLVLINPEIVSAWGEQVREEGCLSLPEIWVKVKRAAHVMLRYSDIDGNERFIKATDLLAVAFQHEIDHLDGIMIVDRISPIQRALISGKLKALRERYRSMA